MRACSCEIPCNIRLCLPGKSRGSHRDQATGTEVYNIFARFPFPRRGMKKFAFTVKYTALLGRAKSQKRCILPAFCRANPPHKRPVTWYLTWHGALPLRFLQRKIHVLFSQRIDYPHRKQDTLQVQLQSLTIRYPMSARRLKITLAVRRSAYAKYLRCRLCNRTLRSDFDNYLCDGFARRIHIAANHKAAEKSRFCFYSVPPRVIYPVSITNCQISLRREMHN